MKCTECLTAIDEFFEGDLEERASGEIAAHIAACADCANALEDLQREQEIYSRYLLDVEATPAVWAGISAGIEKEKSRHASGFLPSFRRQLSGAFARPGQSPLLGAASVVMMFAVAMVLVQYLNRGSLGPTPDLAQRNTKAVEGQPNTSGMASNPVSNATGSSPSNQRPGAGNQEQERQGPTSVKQTPRSYVKRPARLDRDTVAQSSREPTEPTSTSEQIVIDAEQKYQEAIAVLSGELEDRRSQLSQQKLATLKEALSVVDQTIADTSRAARQNSKDCLTVRYMLSAYTAKIDLLREATF